MIGSSNSSFIPKRDPSAVPNTVRRRRVFSLFNVLSTVALLVSLVVAGGSFVYKQQLIGKKNTLSVQLAEQRKALSDADIAAVQNFDRRLRAAEFLVDNHLAPSRLFAALERSTLARVEYSSFTYESTPGTAVNLALTGVSEEFTTIALQAQAYRNEPLLENALITGLSVASAGASAAAGAGSNTSAERVSFEVETTPDVSKLRYDGSLVVAPNAVVPSVVAEPIVSTSGAVETAPANQ